MADKKANKSGGGMLPFAIGTIFGAVGGLALGWIVFSDNSLVKEDVDRYRQKYLTNATDKMKRETAEWAEKLAASLREELSDTGNHPMPEEKPLPEDAR